MRADDEKRARAFLFLGGGLRGLRGLRLGHALLEFVHAAGGIHKFLLPGVERVAGITNADDDHRLGGAGLDDVAARASDFRIPIFRMYLLFHKRLETISGFGSKTRANFGSRSRGHRLRKIGWPLPG